MLKKYAFTLFALLLVCSAANAGVKYNPFTNKQDYTGYDVITTDCSTFTAEGYTCWDSDDNVLYVGNGTSAVSQAAVPGGSNGNIQFNDNGSFGGSSDFTLTTGTTSQLAMTGSSTMTAKTATTTPVIIRGASSQSVPLTSWQDSNQSLLASFTKDSQFITRYSSAGNGFYGHSSAGIKANLAYVSSGNDVIIGDGSLSSFNNLQVGPSGYGFTVNGAGTMTVSASVINLAGTSSVVVNDSGADRDFRVEGDTNANLIFADASTDRVGIGTNTPSVTLDVNGNIKGTTRLDLTGGGITSPGSGVLGIFSAGTTYGVKFNSGESGTETLRLYDQAGGGVTFNESGIDLDFRIESDNQANMLLIDAGTDTLSSTGVIDMGGATSFEVPNGAGGTTVNAAGEVTVDTTSKSLNFYDGAEEKVLQPQDKMAFTLLEPVDNDKVIIDKTDFAITMRSADFVLLGTTATTVTIKAGTNVSGSGEFTVTSQVISSNTVGHTSTSFTDATIPADNWVWAEFSSTSGTPDSATAVLNYTIDP